jgi:hypothetical protein
LHRLDAIHTKGDLVKMSTLKRRLVSVLVVAVVSLGLTGCPSKEEKKPDVEQTVGDVQALETEDANAPTDAQPKADHPAGEHPE